MTIIQADCLLHYIISFKIIKTNATNWFFFPPSLSIRMHNKHSFIKLKAELVVNAQATQHDH